jgi:hypothetical protein
VEEASEEGQGPCTAAQPMMMIMMTRKSQDTYILAASFTNSLHVISATFSFSISVFAACLALPTAQP